jgi:hypothetical protein
VGRKYFQEIVLNFGREVGSGLDTIAGLHREGCHLRAPPSVSLRQQGPASHSDRRREKR